jgi:hypothetical protein
MRPPPRYPLLCKGFEIDGWWWPPEVPFEIATVKPRDRANSTCNLSILAW